jgi:quercetin dioxygenase-like cupin family protein
MVHTNQLKEKEIAPGFLGRFIHGEKSTLAFWEIKKGSVLKEHAHMHEQITYISEGEIEMIIGGEKFLMKAGNTHVIPSNCPHSAIAITDCKIIDSFSPPRDDYRF